MGSEEDGSRKLSELMAHPEADISPISAVGVDESREYLAALPEQYDTVGDGHRIADIGCGDGALVYELAQRYPDADVWGNDLHTVIYAEEYGERHGFDGDNVSFTDGDMFKELPEQDAFDFIYTLNMLQAVSGPAKTVKMFYDSLKDGGHLAVTVPGGDAENKFADYLYHDDNLDLDYILFEDIEFVDTVIGDVTVTKKNYVFDDDTLHDYFTDAGFTDVAGPVRLKANGDSIPIILDVLGEPFPPDAPTPEAEVDLYIAEK